MWVLRQVIYDREASSTALRKDGIKLHFREGIHTFGRQASKCSVVLQGDQEVSREHATINVIYTAGRGGEYGIFIRDGTVNKARSSAGTYVNDNKLANENFVTYQDQPFLRYTTDLCLDSRSPTDTATILHHFLASLFFSENLNLLKYQ